MSRTQISASAIADLKMPHMQQTFIDEVLGVPLAIALGLGVGTRGHDGPNKAWGNLYCLIKGWLSPRDFKQRSIHPQRLLDVILSL